MKLKLFTLFVALIATSSLFAYYVDYEIDGIHYSLNTTEKTAEVVYSELEYYFGSVTIPSSITYQSQTYSVTTIGEYAFEDCSGLTSVTLPNSVTTIGDWAFSDCSSLASVTIGNSVTTIGGSAFWNCKGLTKTNYTGSIADWCKIKFGGSYYSNPIYYSHNFFINDVEVKDLVIPNGVDTIGNYAFESCSGLTSVTIGNSVTTIGVEAFDGCDGLTSITIPKSVTTIGELAFAHCYSLTSVTIGNSVTTIGVAAFRDCSGLTSVTIPNSVTMIGGSAFTYCHGLISVTIGNSVTTIGDGAFFGCSGLTSVTIPNSVTTIGTWAFYYCFNLTSITCEASVPPVCGESCFYSVDKSIPLYVPSSSINAYQSANEWKEFYNIQAIASDALDNIRLTNPARKVIHNGQLIIDRNGQHYSATGQKLR